MILAQNCMPCQTPLDTVITRPALRYHGGKFRLAPWVISFFPKHDVYLDAYGGGASVLIRKPMAQAECYNDLDGSVVSYFRVLRNEIQARELKRRIELTPFSRAEFDWSYLQAEDEVDAAHKMLIRCFMGHGSDSITRSCRTGFRAKVTDKRALPSNEWANWGESIPKFTARLRRVTFENRHACEVITRMDGKKTLIYADPPYLHETRSAIKGRSAKTHGYRFEMSEADHIELSKTLRACRSMVVLSGYPSPLYDRLYHDWEMHRTKAQADCGKTRTEVVWLNPACRDALRSERGLF